MISVRTFSLTSLCLALVAAFPGMGRAQSPLASKPADSIPPSGCRILHSSASDSPPSAPAPRKTYSAMTGEEQLRFIETQARRISTRLSGRHDEALVLGEDALRLIKREVDSYSARTDSTLSGPWRENIALVLDRARAIVPTIEGAFEAEGIPGVAGIYIAMVESEYHPCLTSPLGARGVFQFLPATAEKYGVDPAGLCDLEKSAPAAARYLTDRRAEFGSDALGSAIAVLSYNVGTERIKRDFATVLAPGDRAERERAFWATLARPGGKTFSKGASDEGSRYLPRFLAAAIVGENPRAFGLDHKPLAGR
jgi:hypothetical protein